MLITMGKVGIEGTLDPSFDLNPYVLFKWKRLCHLHLKALGETQQPAMSVYRF